MKYDKVDLNVTLDNWEKWWKGELGRPLFCLTVDGGTNELPPPPLEPKHFTAQYGFEVPVEQIIQTEHWKIASKEYYGDSFPMYWFNFGAGALAAFIGGEGDVRDETIWFYPGKYKDVPIKDMRFTFDPECAWYRRVEEICLAAGDFWQGQVVTGMTDIGGVMDVLSSFRPGEMLLLDLYDHPDEVKRCCRNLNEEWFKVFNRLDEIIHRSSLSSCWAGILCSGRSYILQCDFAYMISPEMFEEFVKPEINYACERLDRSFYHLDGIGQISHIGHLCDIPELDGIQWIPGDGQPPPDQWPDVLRQIEAGGKKIQILMHGRNLPARIRTMFESIDSTSCVQIGAYCDRSELDEMTALMRDYGAID